MSLAVDNGLWAPDQEARSGIRAAKILSSLGVIEIATSARNVCSLWGKICKDPLMWRTIHICNFNPLPCSTAEKIQKFCRYAIDQSRGHLEEFQIAFLGTNAILKYLANSTSQLTRLGLILCEDITDEGLFFVVDKCPQLVELDIYLCDNCLYSLEAVGQLCSNLTTLKFQGIVNESSMADVIAFAIAKTMPNLRHLEIFVNKLTNDGLLAILNGCQHLESLDLRGCVNLNLTASLSKRCSEQVKDLRLPHCLMLESCYYDDLDDLVAWRLGV
ncbi:putative F-box/LRR-repeat protein 23 [Abrus precatorius]|uniref:F-box/LRR-repeat protein 23 n=1 Tax=Abrus precatorius TaxID=3816 RepID=A0A8B8K292_ABRPR|nr:putative F-box/LRR-repeat protein 23 [Abrus precatorius]